MSERQGRSPVDYQSQHAPEVLRRWAEALESYYVDAPTSPKEYITGLTESLRIALQCESYFLAGQRRRGRHKVATIIHTNTADGPRGRQSKRRLSSMFTEALRAKDGTYSRDGISGEEVPYICCAKKLRAPLVPGECLEYSLLLAFFERTQPPDPDFPECTFMTYDQLFLRVAFGSIVSYVRNEHRKTRQVLQATWQVDGTDDARGAAKTVLDFESLLGLNTDPEVLAGWLHFERAAFSDGRTPAAAFEKRLARASEFLAGVEEAAQQDDLRKRLFECWLLYLTKTRYKDMPLLSQRIKKAEEIAGLTD